MADFESRIERLERELRATTRNCPLVIVAGQDEAAARREYFNLNRGEPSWTIQLGGPQRGEVRPV